MKGGKPLFIRRIEIYQIQSLLAKRGKRMDWSILKDLDAETGMHFNQRNQEMSTKEEVVFIRQREIDHILHHLYLNRTEYNKKIMGLLVEQSGMSFIPSRSCFTDYETTGYVGGERSE